MILQFIVIQETNIWKHRNRLRKMPSNRGAQGDEYLLTHKKVKQ